MSLEVSILGIVQTDTVFSCSNPNPVHAEWSTHYDYPIREALTGFVVLMSAELCIGYDIESAALRHGYSFLQEVELQP